MKVKQFEQDQSGDILRPRKQVRGELAPVSVYMWRYARPTVNTSRNLLAHLGGEGGWPEHFEQFSAQSSLHFRQFKSVLIGEGEGGSPKWFSHLKSYSFCELKFHDKFHFLAPFLYPCHQSQVFTLYIPHLYLKVECKCNGLEVWQMWVAPGSGHKGVPSSHNLNKTFC